MRAAAVAVLALLAAPAVADQQIFAAWKALNAKSYASADEETLRYAIFKANLDRINAHNAKGETYTMAMNEFGDLTPREFAAARIGGYKPRKLRRHNPNNIVASKPSLVGAPTSVDWRTKGAVTPVKNQGQCGSCWSFSTTGSVEGAGKIFLGSLVSLSEQMLVDCSGSYGNQGCNGGLMDDAFQYIIANGGLCSEAAYPYTAQDGTCQSSSCSLVPSSKITGYQDVSSGSESALIAAAAQQPVSVAVEADQSAWQFYSGGVVKSNCGTNLDHGVLVVGYEAGYYIVKNSWGASWGEAGYIYIGRSGDGNGVCGIQMEPSYPTA